MTEALQGSQEPAPVQPVRQRSSPAVAEPPRPDGAAAGSRREKQRTELLPAAPPLPEAPPLRPEVPVLETGRGPAPVSARKHAARLLQEYDTSRNGRLGRDDGVIQRGGEAGRARAERTVLTNYLFDHARRTTPPHATPSGGIDADQVAETLHRSFGDGATYDEGRAMAAFRTRGRAAIDDEVARPSSEPGRRPPGR